MGLLRNLTVAVGRALVDTLEKAGEPDPREDEDEDQAPPAKGRKVPPPRAPAEDDVQEAEADPSGQSGQEDAPPAEGDEPAPDEQEGEPVDGQVMPPGQAAAPGAPVAPGQEQPGTALARVPRTLPELEEALSDPKSLFWDPFAVIDALGYKDKPTSITYATLNQMVWRMPIIQAIIKTRCTQVSNFAQPQVDRFSTGYRITLRDKKQKPSPASEQKSQQLERFIRTTGVTETPQGRDSFEQFLQKYVRDSLTYDQACFEIVPARSGKPAAFYAVDASTIRIADTTRLFVSPEDHDVARYVQIYDGLVVAEYTVDELSFGVRNPTSNIRLQQYGQSELEMLVQTVTALLWAWDYNQKFFSQGANVKGIINFKGAVPEKQLRAFRRHWYGMTAGVENAFKTPIVNSDDMQWVNMQATNRDMEFSAWFDFLIKIAASIFEMDPLEVNFKYGDSGGAKSMFESANESKLTASKDRGLKPLLRFISDKVDQSIIQPLDEDFMFEFVGLEASSPSEQADLVTKQVKSVKTVNEARAEEDMPPLKDGDLILDPVYMQAMSARTAQEQQAQQGGPPGMGGPPGAGGPPGQDQGDDQGDAGPPGAGDDGPDVGADDLGDSYPWGAGEDEDQAGEKSLPAARGSSRLRKASGHGRVARKKLVIDLEV
jgi:HK97 family phage portal protein